jgi:biopolymer transport protein ExbB/TolQ
MNLTISIAVMSTILFVVIIGLYKLLSRLVRWGIVTTKALQLLAESRDIESLPNKRDRFEKLMHWKRKRDSLLTKSESLERELSEVD